MHYKSTKYKWGTDIPFFIWTPRLQCLLVLILFVAFYLFSKFLFSPAPNGFSVCVGECLKYRYIFGNHSTQLLQYCYNNFYNYKYNSSRKSYMTQKHTHYASRFNEFSSIIFYYIIFIGKTRWKYEIECNYIGSIEYAFYCIWLHNKGNSPVKEGNSQVLDLGYTCTIFLTLGCLDTTCYVIYLLVMTFIYLFFVHDLGFFVTLFVCSLILRCSIPFCSLLCSLIFFFLFYVVCSIFVRLTWLLFFLGDKSTTKRVGKIGNIELTVVWWCNQSCYSFPQTIMIYANMWRKNYCRIYY